MIEDSKLDEALEAFLANPKWAEYYGNAPSGAKELIALQFYRSHDDNEDTPEVIELVKETMEALEKEDLEYLIENCPNAQAKAEYRKLLAKLGGEDGEGMTGASGATGSAEPTGATGAN